MKKSLSALACILCIFFGISSEMAVAAPSAHRAHPWRVAILVGGPYREYQIMLSGIAERLAELGVIADGGVPVPTDSENLASMWDWLAEKTSGDKIRFMHDAFYSPDWVPERRAKVTQALLARLRDRGDIDCILAFGTWAGQDIAHEMLQIPVLAFSITNPVEAGIAVSPENSGRDNLMVVDNTQLSGRQVRLFHQIFRFSRLGIAYEDTPSGRSSISLEEITSAAAALGVELKRCTAMFDVGDENLAAKRLRACHQNLVDQGADAVYLTYNQALNEKYARNVLEPLLKKSLPTFAQQGAEMVRLGALLSLTDSNIKGEGYYVAESLEKIRRGEKPNALSRSYESIFSLVVNLSTAARIGWNLPMDILAAVDEFYQDRQ